MTNLLSAMRSRLVRDIWSREGYGDLLLAALIPLYIFEILAVFSVVPDASHAWLSLLLAPTAIWISLVWGWNRARKETEKFEELDALLRDNQLFASVYSFKNTFLHCKGFPEISKSELIEFVAAFEKAGVLADETRAIFAEISENGVTASQGELLLSLDEARVRSRQLALYASYLRDTLAIASCEDENCIEENFDGEPDVDRPYSYSSAATALGMTRRLTFD